MTSSEDANQRLTIEPRRTWITSRPVKIKSNQKDYEMHSSSSQSELVLISGMPQTEKYLFLDKTDILFSGWECN